MQLNFPLAKVQLRLRLLEAARLPRFLGSTLRGAFGHIFRRCVCSARRPTCGGCILGDSCPYRYVFETPVPAGAPMMRLYPAAPHPFVIEPPWSHPLAMAAGEDLIFAITLIGRGCDYLPYFVLAFQELGQVGLGPARARFQVEEIIDLAPDRAGAVLYRQGAEHLAPPARFTPDLTPPVAGAAQCRLLFLSPARLKYCGTLAADIPFHVLVRNLLRRLSALALFHCGSPLTLDFRGLVQRAQAVTTVVSSLQWDEYERISGRQRARLALGGVVGEVIYAGPVADVLPLLRLGEWVHVGKATSFGFGRYELRY